MSAIAPLLAVVQRLRHEGIAKADSSTFARCSD